jgi:ABC-2 type transport system permease protein
VGGVFEARQRGRTLRVAPAEGDEGGPGRGQGFRTGRRSAHCDGGGTQTIKQRPYDGGVLRPARRGVAVEESSAANALILIGSWVLLVLVAHVVMNLAVSAASPAPGRTELATQTRLVQIDGLNRYNDLLSADYRYTDQADALLPRNGRLEVSPRLRGFYLTQSNVDRRVQPMLDDFDARLAGQQALVDKFGVLSPAVVLYEGLASLAGNGSRRYQGFQRQAIDYHEAWKTYFVPRVLNGIAITEADCARYPRWTWREEPAAMVAGDAMIRILELLAAARLMTAIGLWRLRRYSPA